MKELHLKLSAWDKLCKWREERQPASAEARDARSACERPNAMERELRAMNARADAEFDKAMSAVKAGAGR